MSVDFSDYTVELFIEANNTLGEGPIWWKRRNLLAWVDILECKIFAATWDGNIVDIITMPEPVGCIFEMPDGSLLAGCQTGLRTVPDGELVARIPDASPDMRINDGKVDPWGNLVFGTMGYPGPREGAGTLWRWDGMQFTALLEGLTIPNGMVWQNDGREFLFIDTPTKQVCRFEYSTNFVPLRLMEIAWDMNGSVGSPDGMCEFGNDVMVAMWDGNCVLQCNENAEPRVLTVPCARPTSVLRAQGSDAILVTSADDQQGGGGDIFRLSPRNAESALGLFHVRRD